MSTAAQIATQMEAARLEMNSAKIAWGRERTSPTRKDAFLAARDRLDELDAARLEAEEREAKERAVEAAAILRDRRATIAATAKRLDQVPSKVDAIAARAGDLGVALAKLWSDIYALEDETRRDLGFVDQECRAIGDAPPAFANSHPHTSALIARLCSLEVRRRNVENGVTREHEMTAALLMNGVSA